MACLLNINGAVPKVLTHHIFRHDSVAASAFCEPSADDLDGQEEENAS